MFSDLRSRNPNGYDAMVSDERSLKGTYSMEIKLQRYFPIKEFPVCKCAISPVSSAAMW